MEATLAAIELTGMVEGRLIFAEKKLRELFDIKI